MITFRYHLVSIAAVLLALAAGVALGAGVLDDSGAPFVGDDRDSADPALVRFEAGYAARTSGGLLEGTLEDRDVVVLTLPGARADEVSGITSDLEKAGATVTGQAQLTAKLVDPANRQFVEGVAQQSAGDVEGVSGDGDSYARVGAALGRAVLGENGDGIDDTATTITAALDEGGLLTWEDGEPESFASLAVVVSGPSRAGETGEVVTGLARALDGAGSGSVLAGPSTSSRAGGTVAALREDEAASQVSSVDVTDTAAGRVVTVLALARDADGQNGAWGTSRSADGAVPQ